MDIIDLLFGGSDHFLMPNLSQFLGHLSVPVYRRNLVFSFNEKTKCCFKQFEACFVPLPTSQMFGKDGLDDL